MHALTIEGIRTLAAEHMAPCVSMYLPAHAGQSREDRAKLEGFVRRARQALESKLSRAEIDAVLAPVVPLLKPEAWGEHVDGLALFVARGFHAQYRLPMDVQELLVVADSFHIRPLLRFARSNQQYFVLLLAQGHVGFLRGSAEGLVPVGSSGVPSSLSDALGKEDRERAVTYHFGARGGKNPIFGGGDKSNSSREEDLARFFRSVDQAIWSALRDESSPLVLVTSDREAALFRSLTRYGHVAPGNLSNELGRATPSQIHAAAWPVVQSLMTPKEDSVLERYDRLVSAARALDDVRAIGKLALEGRVRDLILDRDAHLWGRFDRSTGETALYGERTGEDVEDVLDDIAAAVVLRGGDVWSIDNSRMPTKSSVAATLRW